MMIVRSWERTQGLSNKARPVRSLCSVQFDSTSLRSGLGAAESFRVVFASLARNKTRSTYLATRIILADQLLRVLRCRLENKLS